MRKRLVLRILIGNLIRALKLDANRKIIAGGPAFKLRVACVPGARAEGHELHDLPVAPDERMRGDALLRNLGEAGVPIGREAAREELIDPGTAELARRQTDAMHNDELRHDAGGARIEMRREHLCDIGKEARGAINLHAAK